MKVSSFFTQKLPERHVSKVIEVAQKLKIDANSLLAVMYFETAKTFSPQKTNSIGSVGLIQFTADVGTPKQKKINGKVYSLAYIKSLSFIKQMDLVYEYYKPYTGKMSNFLDVYLVTFFPAALSKSDSFVLKTSSLSASLIALQNPIFDTNKDKQITRQEITDFFKKWYTPSVFQEIQKGFDLKIPLMLLALLFLIKF
ncbi:hypothetical protein [Flavobacterium undicola]|uniref:hypothetical protein n=1 Tax=Flavobacterium undicola TaxID=1932779 RepID=UPI0013767448|nr:hypothetical protein [Flavobacterium undicola]MBA0883803.1 hypothetical protein [Flavobacterium undicola]